MRGNEYSIGITPLFYMDVNNVFLVNKRSISIQILLMIFYNKKKKKHLHLQTQSKVKIIQCTIQNDSKIFQVESILTNN